jgi:hypothetical protein
LGPPRWSKRCVPPHGPRQRTLCYLGEINSSAQARWLKTIEVLNEQGEAQQLKLFPSQVEPPADDPQVARVVLEKVRLERTRQFGSCWLGWELWKRLELDRFFAEALDADAADVPWSRIAAVLAINRLCAPGSELAIEQRWYPSTALDAGRGPSAFTPLLCRRLVFYVPSGNTSTAGWQRNARARTFALSTPRLTRSRSIAEIVDCGMPVISASSFWLSS